MDEQVIKHFYGFVTYSQFQKLKRFMYSNVWYWLPYFSSDNHLMMKRYRNPEVFLDTSEELASAWTKEFLKAGFENQLFLSAWKQIMLTSPFLKTLGLGAGGV